VSDDQPLRPGTDPAGKLAIGSHQRDHPRRRAGSAGAGPLTVRPAILLFAGGVYRDSGQRRSLIADEIAGQRSGCLKYRMRSSAAGFTLVGFGHRPTIATDQTSIT
jgi:hypothetical protein